MKRLFPSVLPAMALLTLGSCAGTAALTSTESDGVYYSSKDRTTAPVQTAVASTEQAPVEETGDVANPDYAGTTNAQSGSTEYYDDDYYAARLRRFHQPAYRGLGLGYYDFAYTDPFWYGGPVYSAWGPGAFYDPFYSPYWGGSFVNINIGFGRPWYRPWRGYGYGYGAYDYGYGYSPYGYGRPWGGYYGGGYYGGLYNGYYGGGGGYIIGPRAQRSVVTGTRSRMAEAANSYSENSVRPITGSRSRGTMEGNLVTPGGSTSASSNATAVPTPSSALEGRGRGRSREVVTGGVQPSAPASSGNQTAETTPGTQPARRWRVLSENGGTPAGTGTGVETGRSRRTWDNVGGTRSQSTDAGGVVSQPRRQRVYDQPSQSSEPTRTYSQPSRSYSEPSRSYSEPSRSYSQPSRSFDGGGGGNSGGGGGGRSSGGGRGRGN
ncbi:hypothetical protein DNI29_14145 [Hymenobacter sediminis]|uniref:hypothetical protein n=1 Tax=Hymenobacter sediminis TaxID=2218621 RepID=UPI000F4E2F7C|nr:hypothetical protein [Hymenobacter sediminis]RPD46144.1 hypothetical protein DNI29_14145 [Hymenobacter sediminis]